MARKTSEFIPCVPVSLPDDRLSDAAAVAVQMNPANAPPLHAMLTLLAPSPQYIAVMTTKYWGTKGVGLGVSFLDSPNQATRNKILAHMNAWGEKCNVRFSESASQGEVRISRGRSGYWSYVGTDILTIPHNEPTMNLQGFTENTPDSEYRRVVRHETGHTLGCPHEHMRRAIINLLDPEKTIAYFRQTQGWSRSTTIQQVLTPVEETSLLGSPTTDQDSIMCYQLPGVITKTGRPVVGGKDITENDMAFMAKLYPKPSAPPVEPSPAMASVAVSVVAIVKALTDLGYKVTK